jgi:VIT1/CCC1 family predicted Fe2+/Mn2+ transporter
MSLFHRMHRHLDPADTLGELIFGLIMVLTFTIGARLLVEEGPTDGRELLIAAIGCNLAWGIIDGFLYVLGQVFERRRLASLIQAVQQERDDTAAMAAIRGELDGDLASLAGSQESDRFYASIAAAARARPAGPVKITAGDLRGAALVLFLVLATAVPAALPFLLIEDGYVALRVSNFLLVGLLFVVGFLWGRHVGSKPLVAGLLIMSIGLALVLVAIPLGG